MAGEAGRHEGRTPPPLPPPPPLSPPPPPPPTSFLAAFGHLRQAPGFADTAPVPRPPPPPSPPPAEPHAAGPRPGLPGNGQQHISAALAHARAKTTMLASSRQRNNPMLAHVRHVRVDFDAGIAPDFVCGATTAVLYLSLQYHRASGNYIYERVRALGRAYRLRVLLVVADVEDGRAAVRELAKLAMAAELTMVCCGSEREAARYCETLRSYDAKTADSIQERVGADFAARLSAALTSVRGVNRSDVATLAFTFGSMRDIAVAPKEDLRQCPGLGERKVARLHAALNQPFKTADAWDGGGADDDEAG
jgi:DNA excision repair protein ERCC-1